MARWPRQAGGREGWLAGWLVWLAWLAWLAGLAWLAWMAGWLKVKEFGFDIYIHIHIYICCGPYILANLFVMQYAAGYTVQLQPARK